jgi:hypothetical protein
VKINVIGDHTYSSPKDCHKEINLKLINRHYTFNTAIKSYSYIEKLIMIYDVLDNGMVTTYEGTIKTFITKKVIMFPDVLFSSEKLHRSRPVISYISQASGRVFINRIKLFEKVKISQ